MLRRIAGIAAVTVFLVACTPPLQYGSSVILERSDIHERLSDVMTQHGFAHELRSRRDEAQHLDSITVRIPLDSLKGRDAALKKLMTDIARICAMPTYAHLPIRILVGAGDVDDRAYLFAILKSATLSGGNVSVVIGPESHKESEVSISVRHPVRGGT